MGSLQYLLIFWFSCVIFYFILFVNMVDDYADLCLKVDTNNPGRYKSLTKIMSKIKGASYTINAEEGMAYITGRADPSKLLRNLQSGKYADICWVKTGNHITYGSDFGSSPQGMTMEQPASNWHSPPHPHPHHHRLPYYQYPYNEYLHYGYWHM